MKLTTYIRRVHGNRYIEKVFRIKVKWL